MVAAYLVLLLFVSRSSAIASTTFSPLKIYSAGSGLGMLSLPETVHDILSLSSLDRPHNVLYLGTASYDAPGPEQAQTHEFIEAGCNVSSLRISWRDPIGGRSALQTAFDTADVVLVSGGNTLYAIDRFKKLGIDELIRQAAERGAVLAGGSAGGIVWFNGGHSDSMKPSSYKNPPGPILRPDMTPEEKAKDWTYVRVPGLGLLSGLFCPHYDTIGANGVPRAEDFDDLIRRHPGEAAIGVDNWAAISVDGDRYTVISREGKPGSVAPDGSFTSNNTLGRPGAWRLHISDIPQPGTVTRELISETGATYDLFQPALYIEPFEGLLKVARAQNPDDGRPAAWMAQPDTGGAASVFIVSLLAATGLVATMALAVFVRRTRLALVKAAAPDELSKLNSSNHSNMKESA